MNDPIEISLQLLQKCGNVNDLNKCETLTLTNQNISIINCLIEEQCQCLRNLNLNHNSILKIENLDCSKLPNLRSIHLSFNCLQSTYGLDGHIGLTSLILSHNQISRLMKLGSLKSLTTLKLAFNQIEKVDGIENLKELKQLDLQGNMITKIDFLIFNKKIEDLNLSRNQIKNVSPHDFSNTPNLAILQLSYNQISDIKFINSMQSLEQLDISHNEINVFGCEVLNDNIVVLDLSSNRIEDVSQIRYKYRNITHLYVQDNEIMTEFYLKLIYEMESLIEVNFLENPFYNQEFETDIILKCPWLEVVNGKEVGRPANYIIKEIKDIREYMRESNIDIDTFTYSDLLNEDDDVLTEEKFKAILRQKGMDSSDEEQLQVEKSELIFPDQSHLLIFLTQNNKQMEDIRQQYINYKQTTMVSSDEEQPDVIEQQQDSSSEPQVIKKSHTSTQSETSIILGKKDIIIRQISKPKSTSKNILPPTRQGKKSILQEISQLKVTQQNPDFQQQMGIIANEFSSSQFSAQLSQENFRQRNSTEKAYKTMNMGSLRSISIQKSERSTIATPQTPASVKLPKITKNSLQK